MVASKHEPPAGGQHYSGHYSGQNKIPNVQEFIAQLDKEKAERDAAIDADLKRNNRHAEASDHVPDRKHKTQNTKTVRDPVTGTDVEIEDAQADFEEVVENPQVRWAFYSSWETIFQFLMLTLPFLDFSSQRERRKASHCSHLSSAVRGRVPACPRYYCSARPRPAWKHV